uniref:Transmembrane protein n=1 Tax=Cacopsylla melanoneura TaxID=428564 RepID=A0A8D8TXA4_9HEMI
MQGTRDCWSSSSFSVSQITSNSFSNLSAKSLYILRQQGSRGFFGGAQHMSSLQDSFSAQSGLRLQFISLQDVDDGDRQDSKKDGSKLLLGFVHFFLPSAFFGVGGFLLTVSLYLPSKQVSLVLYLNRMGILYLF